MENDLNEGENSSERNAFGQDFLPNCDIFRQFRVKFSTKFQIQSGKIGSKHVVTH
jgi:hypothetical protein